MGKAPEVHTVSLAEVRFELRSSALSSFLQRRAKACFEEILMSHSGSSFRFSSFSKNRSLLLFYFYFLIF
jgi:hypothetical protein